MNEMSSTDGLKSNLNASGVNSSNPNPNQKWMKKDETTSTVTTYNNKRPIDDESHQVKLESHEKPASGLTHRKAINSAA